MQDLDWNAARRPNAGTLSEAASAVEHELVTAGITINDSRADTMGALDTIVTEH